MMQSLPTFTKVHGAKYVAGAAVRQSHGTETFAFCIMRQFPHGVPDLIVASGEVNNNRSYFEHYCRKITEFYGCNVMLEFS